MNAQSAAIYFADALSRERSLTSDESNRLCAIVGKPRIKRAWLPKDDAELRNLSRTRLRIQDIAEQIGRTPLAVRIRLSRLKEKRR